MIERIGMIFQDANSLGFIEGIRSRLGCHAELVKLTAPIARSSVITGTDARRAWAYFQKKRVDLIVWFTDADNRRWQEVERLGFAAFPEEARSLLVVGVANRNVEHWLALDAAYITSKTQITDGEIKDERHRTDRIKHHLLKLKATADNSSDVVRRFVEDAPALTFKNWLNDEALSKFYDACRAAAARHGCEVPNERDA